MRHILIRAVGIAVLAGGVCVASAQDLHIVTTLPDSAKPLSPAELTKKIQDAASEYQAYAPIPRVGFYDIAYPASKDEARALNGLAVLLVTGFSQQVGELPFRRVYAVLKGKEIELKSLGSVSSSMAVQDDVVAKTFGRNRSDGLYLLPIYLANRHAFLTADFAKDRDGFKLGEFEGVPTGELKKWSTPPVEGTKPSEEALRSIISREYPGFLAEYP